LNSRDKAIHAIGHGLTLLQRAAVWLPIILLVLMLGLLIWYTLEGPPVASPG
jgi:hypothetical protein